MSIIQVKELTPQHAKFHALSPTEFAKYIKKKELEMRIEFESDEGVIDLLKEQLKDIPEIDDTFELPDGKRGPLELWVVGRNSNEWLDYMREFESKIDGDSSAATEKLVNSVSVEAREFVAKMIVGWLDNGALTVKYSPEAALEMMLDGENTWLLEQLQEFIGNEANFFSMN